MDDTKYSTNKEEKKRNVYIIFIYKNQILSWVYVELFAIPVHFYVLILKNDEY